MCAARACDAGRRAATVVGRHGVAERAVQSRRVHRRQACPAGRCARAGHRIDLQGPSTASSSRVPAASVPWAGMIFETVYS